MKSKLYFAPFYKKYENIIQYISVKDFTKFNVPLDRVWLA